MSILQYENIKKINIQNGLRVWCNSDTKSNSISIRLLTMVGTAHEDKKEFGLAHFVEHLVFEIFNKEHDKNNLTEEIQRNGGKVQAYTSKEGTVFVADIPANQIDNCIELISKCILLTNFNNSGVLLNSLREFIANLRYI